LDIPGERPLTVAERHAKNMAIITNNPTRTLR
jgi:hypothetical protein